MFSSRVFAAPQLTPPVACVTLRRMDSATATPQAPIMVRLSITRAELIEIQKVALERNMSPRDFMAEILRAALNLGGTS